jgi:glucokinase
MKQDKIIGLDIGGTSSKFGVVNSEGQILEQGAIPTCETDDPAHFVKRLQERLKPLMDGVKAIGVGAPNGNFFSGSIELAPNLKWKGIVPMAKMIEEALGVPVRLTNDANAAAMGEMKFGAAQRMKNFIVITLGTGLGSGIVINGEVVLGHSGFAGELGQTIIIPEGRLCGCGRHGCLETYASATGIVKTAREFGLTVEHAAEVADLAVKGNSEALKCFEYTGELLGRALANAVTFSSPEAIFLFGGLVKSGELLMGPVQKHFAKNLHNVYQGTVKVLPSGLKESDAAILGAASLF